MKVRALLGVVAGLCLLLAGCASGSGGSGATPTSAAAAPKTLTVLAAASWVSTSTTSGSYSWWLGCCGRGYLEDWTWHATHSGAPQGGVVSPILSNIYLNRLDTFVEQHLVPAWTRGHVRRRSREYGNVTARIGSAKRQGDRGKVAALRQLQQAIPSVDAHDPDYRRLRYIRYADDHLLGFAGTKAEAEEIKTELAAFLRDELKLTLSTEKTVITHARTHKARFLGYDIWTRQDDTKRTGGGRSINGGIALGVPPQAVNDRCRNYQRGQEKPLIRNDLIRTSDYHIVAMVRHGISRLRPVLPDGRKHQLAEQAPLVHGTVDDVDPGGQIPPPTVGHAQALPNHRPHPAGETAVFRGDPAHPIGRGVHRPVRWHPATTSATCPSHRRCLAVTPRAPTHHPAHRGDL